MFYNPKEMFNAEAQRAQRKNSKSIKNGSILTIVLRVFATSPKAPYFGALKIA
jgi:hypothetical protein